MTTSTQTEELKHRVLARKKELEARLEKLQADTAQARNENAEKLRRKLRELQNTLSEDWDNMKDATIERLNQWLRTD